MALMLVGVFGLTMLVLAWMAGFYWGCSITQEDNAHKFEVWVQENR